MATIALLVADAFLFGFPMFRGYLARGQDRARSSFVSGVNGGSGEQKNECENSLGNVDFRECPAVAEVLRLSGDEVSAMQVRRNCLERGRRQALLLLLRMTLHGLPRGRWQRV